ncbi:PREDICTED: elastin-like [Trachymyrmex cornetzi]|uniref:elastin-like n=1 Tax=Trachymyrmex cornetzi TaxID=471704 RepID=UPI00084F3BE5|nr:PREDICTED: elastin-like [Trachymyrmex cornetzi]
MEACIKGGIKTSAKLQSNQGTASTMRAVMILTLAATAMARPEAGYSYSQPSSSYGAPSGGYSLAGGVGGISGIGGIPVRPSTTFGAGGGFGGGPSAAGVGPSVAGGGPSVVGGTGGIEGVTGFSSGRAEAATVAGSAGGIEGVKVNAAAAARFAPAVQVVRDVYVFESSKDPEAVSPAAVYPSRPAQKHYKIVFIKAPTSPTPTAPVIPVQQQDEQKTLIYVLVKKPEEAPEINLPTITPTQPSKPEVYFIKYKTQKEVTGTGPSTSYGVPGKSGPY